jgi:hypothetical protein
VRNGDTHRRATRPANRITAFTPARRLDLAVAACRAGSPSASDALSVAVAERVYYLRGRGDPPERVLRAIKQAMFGALTRAGLDRNDAEAGRALLGRAVKACIEAYYKV